MSQRIVTSVATRTASAVRASSSTSRPASFSLIGQTMENMRSDVGKHHYTSGSSSPSLKYSYGPSPSSSVRHGGRYLTSVSNGPRLTPFQFHCRHISTTPSLLQDEKEAKEKVEEKDDDPCPEWQNPLHHNNPDYEKMFPEDFGPGEEMPILPLPPIAKEGEEDKVHAPPHIHELADQIVHLNMLELKQLMDRIGNHFGFSQDDVFGGGGVRGGGGEAKEEKVEEVVEEKTIFDLKLAGFDAKAKIKVIKEIRGITSLGLKEAKELVEGAPSVVKKGIKQEEADELKAKLEAVGAQVEIV